jgi:hypothetical protein
MKRIICYIRTIKEWKVFLNALFTFGAIYIAHDYIEVSNKYVKSRKRIESKLKCKTCGHISIAWRNL